MSTSSKLILETFALGRTPYKTFNPFLFCMHHNDSYPVGEKDHLGPNPRFLRDRDIGMDFSYQDGWSMYHGTTVPGFPEHPHRGFETITVANKGLIDHSDSIKCTARYGNGDTQWMTAGKGIQHAEMFPLLSTTEPNTLDLFQIWLNLPKKNKFSEPYFGMFWSEVKPIAQVPVEGDATKTVPVQVIAGDLFDTKALAPPPNSWAADVHNDVAVWIMDVPAGAAFTLPAARSGKDANRALYVVSGDHLNLGEEGQIESLPSRKGARIAADRPLRIQAVGADASVLLLQGRPIDEPVVQHGPFVMNTREEILQCFSDFRSTGFGGWPWTSSDHCHARDTPRHAVHPDGHRELPPNKSEN